MAAAARQVEVAIGAVEGWQPVLAERVVVVGEGIGPVAGAAVVAAAEDD